VNDTVPHGSMPEIPGGFDLPFYYGTFVNIGVDYLVDPGKARALLHSAPTKDRLSAAIFGDRACVSFNYQMYYGQFAHGGGVTQETELNVVAFPTDEAHRTPKLTYEEYATGYDQTRLLGNCRMHVACDSDPAISAGVVLFNEPKEKADFDITLPVANGTPVNRGTDQDPKWEVVWYDTWSVACGLRQQQDRPIAPAHTWFTFTADLRAAEPKSVSQAPFTEYGSRKVGDHYRPLAAPLNVFSPYQWYDLRQLSGKVKLALGGAKDTNPKIREFVALISGVQPAGAWVYQSAPVAAQNRPYWVG
jgi:hypothetical protein